MIGFGTEVGQALLNLRILGQVETQFKYYSFSPLNK